MLSTFTKRMIIAVIVSVSGTIAVVAEDLEFMQGAKDFELHCAICHGIGGLGNGPLAQELVTLPADLTRIAQKNGGNFPEDSVKKTIEYGGNITAHGPSNMLAWGAFFMIEGSGEEADKRIGSLAKYIKSLQQKR